MNYGKRFILIDSLSTFALYKTGDEITRFAEMLIDIMNLYDNGNIIILFNIAEDLVKNKYIMDIALHADGIINFLKCAKKYSREVVDSKVLT